MTTIRTIIAALALLALAGCASRRAPGAEVAAINGVPYYRLDWRTLVPLGLQSGVSHQSAAGRNPDIDTADDPEDIWDGGGLYFWPDTAQTLEVASDSLSDDSSTGGTGARAVVVYGLDSLWAEVSATVAMDGDTAVATAQKFIWVYRAEVTAAGGSGANNGTVTVSYAGDSQTAAVIRPGAGQTLMAIYTTPAGKYGIMAGYRATSTLGAVVALYERPRPDLSAPAWRIRHTQALVAGGSSATAHEWAPYRLIQPKTDIRLTAASVAADNTDISAEFNIILVDTTKYRNLIQY